MNKTVLIFKKTLQLFPVYLLSHFIIIILTIYGLFVILYGFSAGTIETVPAKFINGNQVKVIKYFTFSRVLVVFDLILILSLINLIMNFNKMITIMVTTSWYFTRKKKSALLPVETCFINIIKYHLGTIALYTYIKQSLYFLKVIMQFFYNTLKTKN